MKLYIAAPMRRAKDVKELYALVRSRGHEITSDWTDHEDVRPFSKNAKKAQEYANDDLGGVVACDVFIAICDDLKNSIGTPSELAAAIALNIANGKPRVFIVGEDVDGILFAHHRNVEKASSVLEVLQKL